MLPSDSLGLREGDKSVFDVGRSSVVWISDFDLDEVDFCSFFSELSLVLFDLVRERFGFDGGLGDFSSSVFADSEFCLDEDFLGFSGLDGGLGDSDFDSFFGASSSLEAC